MTDVGSICRKAYLVDRVRILSSIDSPLTIASSTICSTIGDSGNPHKLVLVLFSINAFVVILDDATHELEVNIDTAYAAMWMNFIL